MIVGIIGENSIFTFLQFKKILPESSVDEAIVYSISTRLRPKLMTALGAIIALLPLALGIGAGAQLHQPLAIAVIGGFIIALPLLLIVLPSMMRVIYNKKKNSFIFVLLKRLKIIISHRYARQKSKRSTYTLKSWVIGADETQLLLLNPP